jgi:hypothetical protein
MALASCVLLGVTEATLMGDFSHFEKNTNSALFFIFSISALPRVLGQPAKTRQQRPQVLVGVLSTPLLVTV